MTEGADEPRIGVVTEPFASRPLTDVMEWLLRAAPSVTDLEVGAGGYAPTTHCETPLLLRDASAREAWAAEIASRGLRVAALNVWGNPLHPDKSIAASTTPTCATRSGLLRCLASTAWWRSQAVHPAREATARR